MVAGGYFPSRLAYSYDGINWTRSLTGNVVFTNGCNAVAWNGSLWVAGGSGTNKLGYSSNGIDWSGSSTGTALFNGCNSVAWNGSLWVAGGAGVNHLAYSYDGINWTLSSSGNGILTEDCTAVAWNGSLWVAGGQGTNQVAYSPDGITWTGSSTGNAIFTSVCRTVAWNGSLWVAGGSGTTNRLAYSPDGINWFPSSNGGSVFSPTCYTVAWNGSLWVAGGHGTNKVAYSYDGITWTGSSSGNAIFTGVCFTVASRRPLPYVGTTVVPPLFHQAPLIGPTGGALVFESPTGTNSLHYSRFLNLLEDNNGGTNTLYVRGDVNVSGSVSKSGGSFLIPHPDPAKNSTHMLRHCFVEAPTRGDNLYHWTLTTTNRVAEQELPAYSPFLNEGWQFYVNPVASLEQGYVVLAEDERSFRLLVTEDGTYHVLGVATRKDAAAKAFFDGKGVEFLRG